MCDEDTEAENEAFLERARLNRRELGLGTGAVVATWVTGCAPTGQTAPLTTPAARAPVAQEKGHEPGAAAPRVTSRMVTIETPDGVAEAFFVAPREGRHPGVLLWPDIAGLREAYHAMATRLAESGYAVLAVNHYYRSSKLPLFATFAEWQSTGGREKVAPMREKLSAEAVSKDGAAFVEWLDRQKEVDVGKKLATTGYCMGGPFTFRTAAAVPARVGAIASFHGAGLVTPEPDSPHALLSKIKAAALICVAQNDDARAPEDKSTLARAAKDANVHAEIEVYPAQHGWCTTDSPVFDEAQAERAWARMIALFEAHL